MAASGKRLTVVGGTTLDVIFVRTPALPAWPRHEEFTPQNLVLLREPPIVTLGGNGANAAFVAARGGASVTLHTRLGNDPHGLLARGWLEGAGCRVHTPENAATALNVTAVNRRGERATLFHAGDPPPFPEDGLPHGGFLLVCGWPHPSPAGMLRGLAAARRRGVCAALDAGPILGPAWKRPILRRVLGVLDLFIANEHELKVLTGETELAASLRTVRCDFRGDVVVKRGARGSVWLPAGDDRPHRVRPVAVRAVNTVGAGDSFNGAFLAARARGMDYPEALRVASAVAAGVVGSASGIVGIDAW